MVAVRKDFVGLHRVGLADAHEDEVVEDAFRRQREVDDLREVHLAPSTPQPLSHPMGEGGRRPGEGRAAEVEVFHRREADDGGGIHGVLAVREGGDVEDETK